MAWTEEQVAELTRLCKEGELSASKIVKRLQGPTRNAVISKIHRMGLDWQRSGQQCRPVRVPPAPRPRRINKVPVAPPLAAPKWEAEPEGGVSLVDLRACQCHWPLGGLLDPVETFCGAKTGLGKTYCSKHAAIAYVKPRRNDGTQSKPFTFQPKREAA